MKGFRNIKDVLQKLLNITYGSWFEKDSHWASLDLRTDTEMYSYLKKSAGVDFSYYQASKEFWEEEDSKIILYLSDYISRERSTVGPPSTETVIFISGSQELLLSSEGVRLDHFLQSSVFIRIYHCLNIEHRREIVSMLLFSDFATLHPIRRLLYTEYRSQSERLPEKVISRLSDYLTRKFHYFVDQNLELWNSEVYHLDLAKHLNLTPHGTRNLLSIDAIPQDVVAEMNIAHEFNLLSRYLSGAQKPEETDPHDLIIIQQFESLDDEQRKSHYSNIREQYLQLG